MEKSIEAIWKEGFLKNDALVAPKLNNLYNQKSKDIIDRFKRMFKINLIAIVAYSFIILMGAYFFSAIYGGIALFILLNALVIVGKKELDNLTLIDKGVSSYQYLKAFDQWLKKVIAIYTKIYRFFYPLIFLAFALGMWYSKFGTAVLEKLKLKFPNMQVVLGMPIYGWIGIIVITIIVTIFSSKIYRWEMNVVYGRELKKLEELIADMDELRS